MVLLRFLGRLCAAGAVAEAPEDACNKQARSQVLVQQQPACQHDLALSSLHRLLSGLAGTSFQRIDGLLDALLSPEVTGATSVEFYAVPEGEDDGEELRLILLAGAARPAAKGATEPHADANGTTHLLPDQQQNAIFLRMLKEKVPIHAVLDRCSDSFDTAAAALTPGGGGGGGGTTARQFAALAKASGSRRPRPTRVAAVPLLHGSKLAGALWIEQSDAGEAAAAAVQAPPSPPPLLSDPRALHSLGFACSMCMLGPDGSHAAWLAAVLARLGASECMSALIASLCAAMAAHVRRRFVLDGAVTAALVPPGPDAPPLALLLQPSGPSAAAASVAGAGAGGATGLDGARSGEGLAERRGPSLGGKLSVSCRSPPGGRPTSSNVMLFAAQQLAPSTGGGAGAAPGTWLGGGGGAPAAQSPLTELGGGGSLAAAASKRRLRALGGMLANGLSWDQAALIHARFSLDLSPRHRPMGPSVDIPRSPSLGPIATASSRSIVVPLTNTPGGGAAGGDSGSAQAHAAAAAAAAACNTPTLHARAFPLHRTLLQAHLQQVRRARPSAAQVLGGAVASAPESVTRGGGGGGASVAGARVAALSAPVVFSAVVEDTQLHVQNVHKPSGDVCMLMGLTRKTANGMLGGSGLGGPFGASGTGAGGTSFYHTSGAVSATGMTGGSAYGVGASASVAGAASGGGSAAAAAGVGVPQSLVLLGMQLGGGAALGLYLCFPKRLPGPLLEAVRGSCQELMDKALAPVVRSKLADPAIAPEYETLCCANPGSYAVVRSPSFCSSHLAPALLPPALAAAYMSAATCSDIPSAMAAGGAVGAVDGSAGPAGAVLAQTPPELLSGELSTADMEVLLALQAQQQQQQQGQGGGAGGGNGQGGRGGQDHSEKRGSSSTNRRSGQDRGLAASSFVRRSIAAIGGGGGASSGAAGSAARAAAPHLAAPLSARSASAAERRHATATGLGPVTTTGGGAAGGGGGGPPAAECLEPLNLIQLLQSTPTDLLAAANRTNSLRSLAGLVGLDPGPGGGGAGGGAGGGGGGFTAASIITVSGVDTAATARQQLDLLVSSIHATINTDPAAAGGASSSPMDDLDALELGDVLGQGGGGTVFKGRLGTLDVAVKLMELPKVDPAADAAAAAAARKPAPAAAPPPPRAQSPGGAVGGAAAAATEAELAAVDKLCLNARREMLRNATELAVQSRVSHPNIVQIYATYNDVVMVSKRGPPGCPGSTYRLYPAVLNSGGPVVGEDGSTKERRHVPCVAAAFELCDCGSLGGALAARTFPKAAYRERERDVDGAFPLRPQLVVDMKGVYMTLLDVALALRHLHCLNLVHRDVKPANLLLKSNPRDPRGFTVKLADFGFVLHLSEVAEDGSRYAIADQACGTVTHMAPEALLAKAKIDASVDIYALGILMWEMFSGGVRPFPRLQPDKIPRAVYRGARPTFSEEVPSAYRNLALACWNTDPQRRPRATDVVSMLNGLLQELE